METIVLHCFSRRVLCSNCWSFIKLPVVVSTDNHYFRAISSGTENKPSEAKRWKRIVKEIYSNWLDFPQRCASNAGRGVSICFSFFLLVHKRTNIKWRQLMWKCIGNWVEMCSLSDYIIADNLFKRRFPTMEWSSALLRGLSDLHPNELVRIWCESNDKHMKGNYVLEICQKCTRNKLRVSTNCCNSGGCMRWISKCI